MQVKVEPNSAGTQFTLHAENDSDVTLLDALRSERFVHVGAITPKYAADGKSWQIGSLAVTVSRRHPDALIADAGRECVSAVGNLYRLLFGQAADDRSVGPDTTDPQAQESLAARVVELQLMEKVLIEHIGELERAVNVMRSAHDAVSCVAEGKTTVQGGAAA